MTQNVAFSAPVDFQHEPDREVCFLDLKDARAALSPEELIQVNCDLPRAEATVLGAIAAIIALRAEIAKLPYVDITHIDQLERATLALSYAHSAWLTAVEASDNLVELNREAVQTRDRLYADVQSLGLRNLIDPSRLKSYTGATGYLNVANDVLLLASLLTPYLRTANARCVCTLEEVHRGEHVAVQMTRQVGARAVSAKAAEAAADDRIRAFTLFYRYYDTAQRAIDFLRWNEGDADTIAPSIYANRNRRSAKPEDDQPVEPTPAPTPTPTTTPAVTPAAGTTTAVSVPGGPFVV